VIAELEPAVALSPDRRTLAIGHADAVTPIDTAGLTVPRTIALKRPVG
jgi:hypothetical protein